MEQGYIYFEGSSRELFVLKSPLGEISHVAGTGNEQTCHQGKDVLLSRRKNE